MKNNITKAARRVWKNFWKGVRKIVHNIKLKQNETDISYTRLAQNNRVNYIQPDFDVLYRVLENKEEDDPFRGFMADIDYPFPQGDVIVNNPARIILDPLENELEEIWCEESDATPLSMYFDVPLY